MARGCVGGVVAVWPSVGVEGGARLSDPVKVIGGLLLPVTGPLLKVTHVCGIMFLESITTNMLTHLCLHACMPPCTQTPPGVQKENHKN